MFQKTHHMTFQFSQIWKKKKDYLKEIITNKYTNMYSHFIEMGQVSPKVLILLALAIIHTKRQIDGLVHERRNSRASAMELRLSCTNPSI